MAHYINAVNISSLASEMIKSNEVLQNLFQYFLPHFSNKKDSQQAETAVRDCLITDVGQILWRVLSRWLQAVEIQRLI